MPSQGQSKNTKAASLSYLTTSVCFAVCHVVFSHSTTFLGLISQVANELWEVKGRKIRNLTREDISIVDYKKMLIKNSRFSRIASSTC